MISLLLSLYRHPDFHLTTTLRITVIVKYNNRYRNHKLLFIDKNQRKWFAISELLFFILGLVNSVFLIFIFLIRSNRFALIQQIGCIYFLLAIPAIFGIILTVQEQKSERYIIFLGIFLAFLFIEWLFDYVLKINFRENWKKNWKWTLPYLALYYAMNYGFIVMPWKTNLSWGVTMLCLFVIQIFTNIRSHPKTNTKTWFLNR